MRNAPLSELVVEVLHNQGTQRNPAWSIGSGFVLGERQVLTAAHNVGEGELLVRVHGDCEHPASIRLCGEEDNLDLAMLQVPTLTIAGALPRLGKVMRERAALISGCRAVGFPRFKERRQKPKPLRLSAQVDGEIPTGENLDQDLLTLRVTTSPRPLPQAIAGSEWEGMSGAAVFAGNVLVGVVTEHHLPEGDNALTVVPVTAVSEQPDGAQWWALLGSSPQRLVHLPSADQSTRQHADTPPEPVWNIDSPVYNFTGRQSQLDALQTALASQRTVAVLPTAALHGMAGIGKTQLARAYATIHRDEYQLGWWIRADTELAITTDLAELAIQLGASPDLPDLELAQWARTHLGRRQDWLLVFDNAPDRRLLEPFIPVGSRGHVLITSRNPAWRGLADPVEVDLLSLPEAIRLLADRTGQPDQLPARLLGEELGLLPLALEQAAAYIENTPFTLTEYLQQFRARRAELLDKGSPVAYEGTVYTTFTLAVDHLASRSPAAVQLLRICALLAPDRLPVELLLSQPALLADPLATAATDPRSSAELVGLLYGLSLLNPDIHHTARMHRLVQTITIASLPQPAQLQIRVQAVSLLAGLFPHSADQPTAWPIAAPLFPHARTLLDQVQEADTAHPIAAYLLSTLGIYVTARGLGASQARQLDEQALAMRQRLYKGDHPDIAHSLNNLAADLRDLGKPAAARQLDEQALAMRQRIYRGDHPGLPHSLRLHPGDHPDIAASLTNLASDLMDLGDFTAARELAEQALVMRQRLYEGDHPDLARSLNQLAINLRKLCDLTRARELDEYALAMYQRLYEGDHPAIATSLNNVASGLMELQEPARARELYGQALAMRQRLYEGDHPDIAENLTNLAASMQDLEEPARARELDEQALAMRRRLYEGDHPAIAHSLHNLAVDLRNLGEPAAGRELDEQALTMRQRLYEGDHPDIAASLTRVGSTMIDLEDPARARELFEQALAMYQRLHKGDHPDIAESLTNLAASMLGIEEPARAQELFENALAMRQRLHEGDHPDIAISLYNLAVALQDLGETAEARRLYEQALAMRDRLQERDHHDISAGATNVPPSLTTTTPPTNLGERHQTEREQPRAPKEDSSSYRDAHRRPAGKDPIQSIKVLTGDQAKAEEQHFVRSGIFAAGAGLIRPNNAPDDDQPLFMVLLHDRPQTWGPCPQLRELFARLDHIGVDRLTEQLTVAVSWSVLGDGVDPPLAKLRLEFFEPVTGYAAIVLLAQNYVDIWQYIAGGGLIGITTIERMQHVQTNTSASYGDFLDNCVVIPANASHVLQQLIQLYDWPNDHLAQ